jgi:hypothetical protein
MAPRTSAQRLPKLQNLSKLKSCELLTDTFASLDCSQWGGWLVGEGGCKGKTMPLLVLSPEHKKHLKLLSTIDEEGAFVSLPPGRARGCGKSVWLV